MIVAAGLTPAWQQILLFETFTLGAVNRAVEAHWCASGKVLNAGLALHHLGGPCKTLCVAGGPGGDAIRREFQQFGVLARWVESAAPTRVCTTILDRQTSTELVENARELPSAEQDAFVAAFAEEAASASLVVLSGSLPAGTPPDFYHRLLVRTRARAVLDIRGEELLHTLSEKPFLVKPNREELGRTVGRALRTEAELFEAMQELNQRGAEWVVITDGKNPLHASSKEQLYRVLPLTHPVVNPIGCGDCLAAGIAWATDKGLEPVEAIRYGVAAAADNLGQLLPARLDPARVEALARKVEVVRL